MRHLEPPLEPEAIDPDEDPNEKEWDKDDWLDFADCIRNEI